MSRATPVQIKVLEHLLKNDALLFVNCELGWRGSTAYKDRLNQPIKSHHRYQPHYGTHVSANCFRAMLRKGYLTIEKQEIDQENHGLNTWYEVTDEGREAL